MLYNNNEYDVIVVGGGIAGLTSAAFLSKAGFKLLLCEKQDNIGGLVNSFKYKDYTFDGGIRAIENAGIVFPMLKSLGINIEFVKSHVSIGIEDEVIKLNKKNSIDDYKNMLAHQFPQNLPDIECIIKEIKEVMKYMNVLYGIDNPIFRDLKSDKEYIFKTLLPWLIKYQININKAMKLNEPVNKYLNKCSSNSSLIDMITQHFFTNTPTFFALSYFSLYLDYNYPKGGTGVIAKKLSEFIESNNGKILKSTNINYINIKDKYVESEDKNIYKFKKLVWASDLKKLYSSVDIDSIDLDIEKNNFLLKQDDVMSKSGSNSIFTLYLMVNMDKSYFEEKCGAHIFYTPSKDGLSSLKQNYNFADKNDLLEWLSQYLYLTTYEISIPVIRDINLSPKNKTGLIVSTLMDYDLVKKVSDEGWYEDLKKYTENYIVNILNNTLFKEFKEHIEDKFSSTPITIEKKSGSSHGAITGWSFKENIPVESRFKKIANSIYTPIADVYQAGQWSFSPSGLPVSILTGKLAADKVIEALQ